MHRRSGFSFAEVLFAVAVLGIGLIMVAAIFPAAILQTQAAMDEHAGMTVAGNAQAQIAASPVMRQNDGATIYMEPTGAAAVPPALPPSPRVFSFRDPRITDATRRTNLWNSICGNLIDSTDPRMAWIALYSRDPGSSFIRTFVFAVRSREAATFDQTRDAPTFTQGAPAVPPIELEPKPVAVTLQYNLPAGPNTITIEAVTPAEDAALAPLSAPEAAASGAYVIISDDGAADIATTISVNEEGAANARVYRLGSFVSGVTWELSPDGDMKQASENLPSTNPGSRPKAIAFIVGAGYKDPANQAAGLSTVNRAVQYYPSAIRLR